MQWQNNLPKTIDIINAIPKISDTEKKHLLVKIKQELKKQDAVLVAHYYTAKDLQQLADDTGGCVSDSLEMARFGKQHSATTLIVAGVRFMGETAKILSPEKRVLMPTLEAECSLDLGCNMEDFSTFCAQHPDRTVVVYANTSAKVKARADWVVTSGIASKIVAHLAERGEKILWAPDKHLGAYIQKITQADMLLWDGSCVVHDEFKTQALVTLRQQHPDAAILVHPESPYSLVEMADVVGSTTQLIKAVQTLPNKTFIVATDNGIFYKMQQIAPEKQLLEAPTGGIGGSCQMCAHCPWMAMNSLSNLLHVLETGENAIQVREDVRKKALVSTQRMIDFANKLDIQVAGKSTV